MGLLAGGGCASCDNDCSGTRCPLLRGLTGTPADPCGCADGCSTCTYCCPCCGCCFCSKEAGEGGGGCRIEQPGTLSGNAAAKPALEAVPPAKQPETERVTAPEKLETQRPVAPGKPDASQAPTRLPSSTEEAPAPPNVTPKSTPKAAPNGPPEDPMPWPGEMPAPPKKPAKPSTDSGPFHDEQSSSQDDNAQVIRNLEQIRDAIRASSARSQPQRVASPQLLNTVPADDPPRLLGREEAAGGGKQVPTAVIRLVTHESPAADNSPDDEPRRNPLR